MIILGDFSQMMLMLHAMFMMRMGHYIVIATRHVGTGICTVPTADTVATGKVNCCYNLIV